MLFVMNSDFVIVSTPKVIPYIVFVDDTCRNMQPKINLLGLCVRFRNKKRRPKPKLSFSARRFWSKNKALFDTYNSNSGISSKGIKTLTRRIRRDHNNIKSLIFDWDKTLTQHSNFKVDVTKNVVAECYFGGYKRVNILRTMFRMCNKYDIPVYIVTFNRKAKSKVGKGEFYKALAYVKCTPERIIYSEGAKMSILQSL